MPETHMIVVNRHLIFHSFHQKSANTLNGFNIAR